MPPPSSPVPPLPTRRAKQRPLSPLCFCPNLARFGFAYACQHAPFGRSSARSSLADFTCQQRCGFAYAFSFLPVRAKPATQEEPSHAAVGFDAQGGTPRRLPDKPPTGGRAAC